MPSNAPFIRNTQLLIGPLAEDQGGGPADEALEIISDGSRSRLATSFNVTKTIYGAPNESSIRITNLAPNTRRRIQAGLTNVVLNVGYENTGLTPLLRGGILRVIPRIELPDYVVEIVVMEGFGGRYKGTTSRTFSGRMPVKDVVTTLGQDMPGVTVSPDLIRADGTLGSRGLSVSGPTKDALDTLADGFGFSWSIQDGNLTALQDDQAYEEIIEISVERRNLISVSPNLAGTGQLAVGVDITAVMDPRVRPGQQVELVTNANPRLSGTYRIQTISFQGGTHQNDSIMQINAATLQGLRRV